MWRDVAGGAGKHRQSAPRARAWVWRVEHGLALLSAAAFLAAWCTATDTWYSDKVCVTAPDTKCRDVSRMCIPGMNGGACGYCAGRAIGSRCGDSAGNLCHSSGSASCGGSYSNGQCDPATGICKDGTLNIFSSCSVPVCSG